MIFNKKKLIMILLFSVVLFATISTTWAADIDDSNINNVALNETKSFDEIQGLIDSAENDTIYLNGDTYISSGSQIILNKTLTIDGQGATLDGNYSSRIFEVTQNNCVFKNINFINAHALIDGCYEDGGAILFNCDNGYVENCTFTNCTGGLYGGAVFGGFIFNSTFENNEASKGGAIAYAYVLKSTFKDNIAVEDLGGKSLFSCNAYNCIFIDGEEGQWDPSECDVGNYTYIVFAEDSTVNVGEEAYIKIKVIDENRTPIVNKIEVEIELYNETSEEYYTVTYNITSNEEGIAIFNCSNFTNMGGILAGVAKVFGDNLSNEDSFRLFINKNASFITVDVVGEPIYSKNVNLTATVTDKDGNIITDGELVFIINGEEFGADVVDGKYVYEYKNIEDAGLFNIIAEFSGNDQLNESSKSYKMNVSKLNTTLSLSITGNYYKTIKLKVVLAKCNVDTVPVTLTFSNGKKVTLNLNDGVGYYYVPYTPGNYNVIVSINNDLFSANPVNQSFNILKASSAVITPTKLTTTYDSGKYFQVKVTMNGTAMNNVKLKVNVYTDKKYKTYYITTGTNGIAKLSASKLAIGEHKVYVYNAENTTGMTATKKLTYITVKKATTTVTAEKVTYKYKAKKYFKVTIKNKATGKVVSGIYVKIKVYTGKKYKTYKVKTNSKGVASLSTKSLKRGSHKVVITSGNSKYTISKSGYLIKIK